MTDIVQQLHDLYRSHPVVMQAADEIERLRQIKADPSAIGGPPVSTLGINEIKHKCCSTFAQAQTSGTDNESYGPLLYPIGHNVYAGTGLLPFACCPWCGKEIEEPSS
jgi:hypothetical protein